MLIFGVFFSWELYQEWFVILKKYLACGANATLRFLWGRRTPQLCPPPPLFLLQCGSQSACCCTPLYEQITTYFFVCAASTEFVLSLHTPGKLAGLNCTVASWRSCTIAWWEETSVVELDHFVKCVHCLVNTAGDSYVHFMHVIRTRVS